MSVYIYLFDTVIITIKGKLGMVPSVQVILQEVRNIVRLSRQLEYKKSRNCPSKTIQYETRLQSLKMTKDLLKISARCHYQKSIIL